MKLTDTSIRNAKSAEKPYRIFDGAGLYLEVSPGAGKWWRFKYRFAVKEKRLSLGVYPDVDLKGARKRTVAVRQLLSDGIDPSVNRKAVKATGQERAANSFEVIARQWVAKQMPIWAINHGNRILARFERDIFPWIGGRPVADVTAPCRLINRAIWSRSRLIWPRVCRPKTQPRRCWRTSSPRCTS